MYKKFSGLNSLARVLFDMSPSSGPVRDIPFSGGEQWYESFAETAQVVHKIEPVPFLSMNLPSAALDSILRHEDLFKTHPKILPERFYCIHCLTTHIEAPYIVA